MWTGLSLVGWWMILSLKNRAAVAFAMFFVFFQIFVIIMWLSIYPNPGSWPLLVSENLSTCSSTSNNFENPNVSYIIYPYKPRSFGKSASTKVLSVDLQERRTDKHPRDIYEELAGLLMCVQGQRTVLVIRDSSDGKFLYETSDDLMKGWMVGYNVMFPDSESWPNFFVVLRYCKLPCRVIFISWINNAVSQPLKMHVTKMPRFGSLPGAAKTIGGPCSGETWETQDGHLGDSRTIRDL